MNTIRSMALVSIMLAASAQGARADDMFGAFRDLCVAARADDTQALAAADRSGWMPIPQPIIDKFPKSQFLEPKGPDPDQQFPEWTF